MCLTLAPAGKARSDNPWHVYEYRAHEFAALCRASFTRVDIFGVFHARRLRAHELALRLGWDAAHSRLGLTERFYGASRRPSRRATSACARATSQAQRALDFLAVPRMTPSRSPATQ